MLLPTFALDAIADVTGEGAESVRFESTSPLSANADVTDEGAAVTSALCAVADAPDDGIVSLALTPTSGIVPHVARQKGHLLPVAMTRSLAGRVSGKTVPS